jgi:antitoxin component YwqK of YwqJK toxin-antitoxin module
MEIVPVDQIDFADDYLFMYKGTPFTGVGREYTSDQVLVCEMTFSQGIREGPEKIWYPSGVIKEERSYRSSTLQGICRKWDPTGRLRHEDVYELGICLESKEWDEGGDLVSHFQIQPGDPQYKRLELYRTAKFK